MKLNKGNEEINETIKISELAIIFSFGKVSTNRLEFSTRTLADTTGNYYLYKK